MRSGETRPRRVGITASRPALPVRSLGPALARLKAPVVSRHTIEAPNIPTVPSGTSSTSHARLVDCTVRYQKKFARGLQYVQRGSKVPPACSRFSARIEMGILLASKFER